jgi:hypothetical protein
MGDSTYNGWTNYETWAVKLWMDNDKGAFHEFQRLATAARSEYELAQMIKAEHEEVMPELEGFAADLLQAAFGEVNWDEIASYLYEEAHEDDEEDEEESA